MKKKILVVLVAVTLVVVGLMQVIPALADSSNPLDHITLTPSSATVTAGGTQQFTVQAFDASNAALNVTYFWMVTNGGGTINSTGLFTAGGTAGTFANTVEVVAVQGSITKTAFASVTVSGTAGPLSYVTVTPATATVVTGGTRQFAAQGYDASNVAISGLTYVWSASTAAGTIGTTGLFTAGSTIGTYTNAVQATVQGTTVTGNATVTVSATTTTTTTTTPIPGINTDKFIRMFKGLLNTTDFANFLGGQFQVVSGGVTQTIVVTPGVVQSATATSITVLPNGQTAAITYTLPSTATIMPKNTQFAAGNDVIVVTDNGQVSFVVKVNAAPAVTTTQSTPPGLRNKENGRDGKSTPPGWSHGKKVGWGMDSQNDASSD